MPDPQHDPAGEPSPTSEPLGAAARALRPRATPRRRRSLKHDLLPPLVVFGGLAATAGTWLTRSSLQEELRTQALQRINAMAAAAARAAGEVSEMDRLEPLLTGLSVEDDVQLILVVVGDPPKVVASTLPGWPGLELGKLPAVVRRQVHQTLRSGQGGSTSDRRLERIVVTAPILGPPDKSGLQGTRGAVAVHVDAGPLEAQLALVTIRTIAWQVGGIFLTTLVAFLLLRQHVLRPLSAIQVVMDRRTQGQAGERAPVLGTGELAGLAEALNRMVDVTEAQRDRITTLVANVPGAVYRCTRDDPPKVVFMSQAIVNITGFPASVFVGPDAILYSELIHPEDQQEVRRGMRAAVDALGSYALEYRVRHVDGDWRWVSERGRVATGRDGRIVSLDGVIWDVSERKRAEEQLGRYVLQLEASKARIEQQAGMLSLQARELAVARDRALEGARAKSDFLATMSHEIRTPMNGVIGMTELLLAGGLDPDQRQLAAMIQSSGEALLTIVNDVLDFSKIDAGRLELETIDFELGSVVEDAVELFAERAHSKGLELVPRLGADLPRTVCGDPGRLRQVLLNLIGNAVKFTEQGRIVVAVQRAEGPDGAARVTFRVTDTGIGIPREVQRRLFQSFSQADASTMRRFGGTGLGLAISRRLVDLMGGSIEVESEPGQGSSFWFSLGFQRAEGRVEPDARLGGVRALVAMEDATGRAALVEMATSEGLATRELASAEALQRELCTFGAAWRTPRVVLVDARIAPDGRTLAHLVPADGPAVVLLVPLAERIARENWVGARVDAWLTRPTRRRALRRALLEALEIEHEPPAPLPRREPVAELSGTEAIAGARVLVVEDNAVNRKLAIALLARFGIQADVACDGAQAVEVLARERYDLVIMDCQMPRLDGYEATRCVREMEGTERRTPILAMTANAMEGDRERCLEAGMDDYVTKPIRPAQLREAIERLLRPVEDRESPIT